MLLHFQPISEYKLNVQIRGLGCLGSFPRTGKGLAAYGDLVDHDAHLTKTNRELCGKTCLSEESRARWECLVPSSYRVTDEDRPEKSCGFRYKRLAQSLKASQTMTQTLQDSDKESLSVEIQHSWTACPFSKGI